MEIQVTSHASIRLKEDKVIYFDPYDVRTSPHDADYIFITHDHYDHYDPKSIERVSKKTTKIFTPTCLKERNPYKVLEPNEIYREGNDFIVNAIPAYNKNKPFHPKEKEYLGYNLLINGTTYYIMGDTDRTKEADEVQCDVCFVPIGGEYTMNVEEAISYINYLKPKKAIPIHYGKIVGDISLGEILKEKVNKEIEVELLIDKYASLSKEELEKEKERVTKELQKTNIDFIQLDSKENAPSKAHRDFQKIYWDKQKERTFSEEEKERLKSLEEKIKNLKKERKKILSELIKIEEREKEENEKYQRR